MFKKNLAFPAILFLIALDQITKFWARLYLAPKVYQIFIPGFLEFRYAENTGVAFSFLESYPQILLIAISIINIAILVFLFRKTKIEIYWIFIFAGAFSNLLDRYLMGFVTDFINPTFMNFAVFNVADVFLNIGLYIYLYFCFVGELSQSSKAT